MSEKQYNSKVTNNRRYNISFVSPFFSFYNCVSIEISQKDLLGIIRTTKNQELQKQLKNLIKKVDEDSEYKTDIENQKLCSREIVMKTFEREVTHKKVNLR